MATQTLKAPRCDNHPPMSALYHCDACKIFLCKLCVTLDGDSASCQGCGKPCRKATAQELGLAVAGQTSVLRKRESTVRDRTPGEEAPSRVLSKMLGRPVTESKSHPVMVETPPAPPRSFSPSAPAPQPVSEAAPVTPVNTAPVPLNERKPPYFCKNHASVKATRRCESCKDDYCNTCAKMVEDNPHCPGCGTHLKALSPEDQGFPPKPLGKRMAEAFAFPLKGEGKWLLLTGSIFLWILGYGGWKAQGFAYGFMFTYLMKICKTSAVGRETPPGWPSVNEIGSCFSFVLVKVIAVLPALLFLIFLTKVNALEFYTGERKDDSEIAAEKELDAEEEAEAKRVSGNDPDDPMLKIQKLQKKRRDIDRRNFDALRGQTAADPGPIYYILVFAGQYYMPMALLAVILFRDYSVLNPAFVFSSISRVSGPYWIAYLILLVAEITSVAGVKLQMAIPVAGTLMKDFIWLFLMMVQMRVLGELYYFNQKKLAWF